MTERKKIVVDRNKKRKLKTKPSVISPEIIHSPDQNKSLNQETNENSSDVFVNSTFKDNSQPILNSSFNHDGPQPLSNNSFAGEQNNQPPNHKVRIIEIYLDDSDYD